MNYTIYSFKALSRLRQSGAPGQPGSPEENPADAAPPDSSHPSELTLKGSARIPGIAPATPWYARLSGWLRGRPAPRAKDCFEFELIFHVAAKQTIEGGLPELTQLGFDSEGNNAVVVLVQSAEQGSRADPIEKPSAR